MTPTTPADVLRAARTLHDRESGYFCVTTAVFTVTHGATREPLEYVRTAIGLPVASTLPKTSDEADRWVPIWNWWDGATAEQRDDMWDRAIALAEKGAGQ